MTEQPATWTTIGPRADAWVALGRDCYVRASEVVAVGSLDIGLLEPAAANRGFRALVLLRTDAWIPAYVSAATVVKRLREVGA